jgi:hypothetical protein
MTDAVDCRLPSGDTTKTITKASEIPHREKANQHIVISHYTREPKQREIS